LGQRVWPLLLEQELLRQVFGQVLWVLPQQQALAMKP
jgi:hypothetical protein